MSLQVIELTEHAGLPLAMHTLTVQYTQSTPGTAVINSVYCLFEMFVASSDVQFRSLKIPQFVILKA